MRLSITQIEKIFKRLVFTGKAAGIVFSVFASVVLLHFAIKELHSRSWSGFGPREAVSTTTYDRDSEGNTSKTTTITQEPGKLLWEWFELLLVPLILVGVGYFLQRTQLKSSLRDKQEEALQDFFDRISSLLVEKQLLSLAPKIIENDTYGIEYEAKQDELFRRQNDLDVSLKIIQARTLSILRKFKDNPELKESVLLFLIETGILGELKISLREAELSRTNLSNLDLSGIDFERANFAGSVFSKTNFKGANLSSANFSNSEFYRTNFEGVNLSGSRFHRSNFFVTEFKDATAKSWLAGNDFWDFLISPSESKSNALDVDFSRSNFHLVNFGDCKLGACIFSGCRFTEVSLRNSDFSGSLFHNADLRKTTFYSVNVSHSEFFRANLKGSKIIKSDLYDISFLFSKLRNVKLLDIRVIGNIFTKKQMKKLFLCRVSMGDEKIIRDCDRFDMKELENIEM
ncbi:MAG: pentapeptide repeat-containing protein [Cyanobacteria bacterium P01_H01_bin.152]